MDALYTIFDWLKHAHTVRWYVVIGFGFTLYSALRLLAHFTHPEPRYGRWLAGLIASFVLTLASIASLLMLAPDIVEPSLPLFEPVVVAADTPFAIVFDRPIAAGLAPQISPDVPGTWEYTSNHYGPLIRDGIRFVPDSFARPAHEYTVSMGAVKPLLWFSQRQSRDTLFVFQTDTLPELAESTPRDGQEGLKTDEPIVLTFDKPAPLYVDWSFALQPLVGLVPQWSEDRTSVALLPEQPLAYDTSYRLDVYRSLEVADAAVDVLGSSQELVGQVRFTTIASAVVRDVSVANRLVLPEEPVQVTFGWPMQQRSVDTALSIEPAIAYSTSWIDERTMTIAPESRWQRDTTYVVTIDTSAETVDGGGLVSPYSFVVRTVGPVAVERFDPYDASVGVDVTQPLVVYFDQPVDTLSAELRVALNPGIAFDTSWDDTALTITPRGGLGYDRVYTLSVSSGVEGIYGEPSVTDFSTSFRTQPAQFRLEVPLYKQTHTFTCFSSAARMALAYRGHEVSELGFWQEIGLEDVKRNFVTNVWGDPNSGVVGSYNGSGDGGYGAHWGPVAEAMQAYTPTEVKRSWNIPEMLEVVAGGDPVMVWWVNGVWPAKDVSWSLPSGESVYTVNGMHVEVVTGWIGSKSNPEYILTNDPWRGYRKYTQEQFLNLWRWFDNTGVIVR